MEFPLDSFVNRRSDSNRRVARRVAKTTTVNELCTAQFASTRLLMTIKSIRNYYSIRREVDAHVDGEKGQQSRR